MHFPSTPDDPTSTVSPKTVAKSLHEKEKEQKDGAADIIGTDKFGPVPYLCSLRRKVTEDIGYGRCGNVKCINWYNKHVCQPS